jgi:hypothetical protein
MKEEWSRSSKRRRRQTRVCARGGASPCLPRPNGAGHTGLAIRPARRLVRGSTRLNTNVPELVAQAMMDAWCLNMRALSSRMHHLLHECRIPEVFPERLGTDANTCQTNSQRAARKADRRFGDRWPAFRFSASSLKAWLKVRRSRVIRRSLLAFVTLATRQLPSARHGCEAFRSFHAVGQ